MKKISKFDLKEKTIEELTKTEFSLEKELFNLRFNKVFSAIKDLKKISKLKKMISRVKTIKTQAIKGSQSDNDNSESK